eukprot:15341972-Ditylum_brightwellii.AAC.1
MVLTVVDLRKWQISPGYKGRTTGRSVDIKNRSIANTTLPCINLNLLLQQLGVLNNLLALSLDKFERRMELSNRLAHRISKVFIMLQNALRIYLQVWLSSMKFPLAVTSYTKAECASLMKPFLNAIICKLSFNKTIPRAVIHITYMYCGFEFAHLYFEHGLIAPEQFIGHTRTWYDRATVTNTTKPDTTCQW